MTHPTQADVSPNKNHTGASTDASLDFEIATLAGQIAEGDLDPISIAEACRDILERGALTQRDLSFRIGVGEADLSKLLRILEAPEEAREKVRAGEMAVAAAYRLVKRRRAGAGLIDKDLLEQARVKARECRHEDVESFIARAIRREIRTPSCEVCFEPSIGGGRWCMKHMGGLKKWERRP